MGISEGGEGLDMIGRAKVGGGRGPEAILAGDASPARFYVKARQNCPQCGPVSRL
jgi:hypothetical protein